MPFHHIRTRLGILVLLLAMPSLGRTEPVPIGYFVNGTDAIVLGRLTIVTLHSTDDEEKGTGFVTVEEVVAGPVEVGDSLPYEWHARFDTGVVCPPGYRRQAIANLLGLWFLDRSQGGNLGLNGEFWNLEQLQSAEYHSQAVATVRPRTERTSLVLSVIEREVGRIKGLQPGSR